MERVEIFQFGGNSAGGYDSGILGPAPVFSDVVQLMAEEAIDCRKEKNR